MWGGRPCPPPQRPLRGPDHRRSSLPGALSPPRSAGGAGPRRAVRPPPPGPTPSPPSGGAAAAAYADCWSSAFLPCLACALPPGFTGRGEGG